MFKIYGICCLGYAGGLFVLAFAGMLSITQFQRPEAIGIAMVITAVIAMPAIITYTRSGLNSEPGDREHRDCVRRHDQLSIHSPRWNWVWPGTLTAIVCSFLLAFIPGFNFFFAFFGVFAAFAAIWTLYFYPIAKRLFVDDE